MDWPVINTFLPCKRHSARSNYQQNIEKNVEFSLSENDKKNIFVASKNGLEEVTIIVNQAVDDVIDFHCLASSNLTVRLIILFPEKSTLKINMFLCEDNAQSNIVGLYALTEDQQCHIITQQIHCGKNTKSSLVLQGLLAEKSYCNYDGTIRIEKQASKTYALQNNKNILLSPAATAISVPNIEVLNNDVQCFHGTAIGKFDQLEELYMKSRGLQQGKIKELLIGSLFESVLKGYREKDLILKKVYGKL